MLTVSTATLIRRYYEEIANQSDAALAGAAADGLLTPDFVFHAPNDVEGKVGLDRHKQWQVWHHGVAPDQTFTVEDLIVDDVRGAARWTVHATHRGDFLGIPASGRTFVLAGLDYFRFSDDGHIAELWRSFDLRELVRQLSAPIE